MRPMSPRPGAGSPAEGSRPSTTASSQPITALRRSHRSPVAGRRSPVADDRNRSITYRRLPVSLIEPGSPRRAPRRCGGGDCGWRRGRKQLGSDRYGIRAAGGNPRCTLRAPMCGSTRGARREPFEVHADVLRSVSRSTPRADEGVWRAGSIRHEQQPLKRCVPLQHRKC